VQDALNEDGKALKNAKVLVLGVSYKKDIQDMRESPSIDVIKLLQERGADVSYHDPHVPNFNDHGVAMTSVSDLDTALVGADVVVITTDHSAYDYAAIKAKAKTLVDTRNATAKVNATVLA